MTVGENGASLLARVLRHRQLRGAAQLFSLPDYDILAQLYLTVASLKEIFTDPNYTHNLNDQSVVELVLSRVTAAIRESGCIETYAAALVDMLEACLPSQQQQRTANATAMPPAPRNDNPHCKIALELLSTLFLYHSKRSVMTLAIPVAVRALGHANTELVRHTTSYLSLAAIHNALCLAQHSVQIIANILNGNCALIRVLPQLYAESREPFHAHLAALLRLLHDPSTQIAEKLCLLQLASMITNSNAELIVPHLAEFDDFLLSTTTCTAVLHILLSLISVGRADCLVERLVPLRRAARRGPPIQNNLATIAKVVGVVGQQNSALAAVAVPDLITLCHKSNAENLPILLKEIEGVAELYPDVVRPHMKTIRALSRRENAAFMRIHGLANGDDERRRSRMLLDAVITDAVGSDILRSESTNLTPNLFDTISGKFIDSTESLSGNTSTVRLTEKAAPHKTSATSSNFPNDPFPPTPAVESTVETLADNNLVDTPLLAFDGAARNVSSAGTERAQLIVGANAASELDRNMQTLADAYRPRSNGSLAVANRSLASLSATNALNSNCWDAWRQMNGGASPIVLRTEFCTNGNGDASHDLISFQEEPHHITPRRPPLAPLAIAEPPSYEKQQHATNNGLLRAQRVRKASGQHRNTAGGAVDMSATQTHQDRFQDNFNNEMLSRIPFQMGRDGRVRPVSGYKHRNFADWLAKAKSDGNDGNTYVETTFPVSVSDGVVVHQKAAVNDIGGLSLMTRGRVVSGTTVGSVTKIFVDEHQSAKHTRSNTAEARSVSRNTTDNVWNERGDVVKQFVENRRSKILRYIAELSLKYPIPSRCTLERPTRGRGKSRLRIHFACQTNDPNFCVFDGLSTHFNFKTKIPTVWLHLMFLQMETRSIEHTGAVLSQQSIEFRMLDACWHELPVAITHKRTLATLVTSAFPTIKEQSQLLKELQTARYFDSFSFNASNGCWACFGCAHPDRVRSIFSRVADCASDMPLLEGQLKEKRSGTLRWRLFRRWHTKYFTLNAAALTSSDGHSSTQYSNAANQMIIQPSLDLRKIRSVKSVSRGRKSRKSLPRAFELFTDDNKSLILKADDRKKAEEWFQCLQIAVAHAQKHETPRPSSAITRHTISACSLTGLRTSQPLIS